MEMSRANTWSSVLIHKFLISILKPSKSSFNQLAILFNTIPTAFRRQNKEFDIFTMCFNDLYIHEQNKSAC